MSEPGERLVMPPAPLARRPSGQGLLVIGIVAMCAGAGAIALGLFALGVEWAWAGAGLFNLGLLLWALGTIVRALFFLPGRQVDPEQFWKGDPL